MKQIILHIILLAAIYSPAAAQDPSLPSYYPPADTGVNAYTTYRGQIINGANVSAFPLISGIPALAGGAVIKGSNGRVYYQTPATNCYIAGNLTNSRTLDFSGSTLANTPNVIEFFQYGEKTGVGTLKALTTLTIGNTQKVDALGKVYPETYLGVSSDYDPSKLYRLNVNNIVFNKTQGGNNAFPTVFSPNKDIFLHVAQLEIAGQATFTSGRLYESGGASVVFLAGASSTGGSINSYVDGPVSYLGNTGFTYPLGDESIYSPLVVTYPDAVNYNSTLRYNKADGGNTGSMQSGILQVSNQEFYDVTSNAPAGSTLTMHYDNFGALSPFVVSASITRLVGYDGAQWINLGPATVDLVNHTVTTTLNTNLSSVTKITLALGATALSVHILDLNATKENQTAKLEWTIGATDEAEEFIVERSTDGISFNPIARVDFQEHQTVYHAIDDHPVIGKNWYRIMAKEQNGDFHYTQVRMLEFSGQSGISIYPNPFVQTVNLNASGDLISMVIVYDEYGRQLQQVQSNASSDRLSIDMGSVADGVYILRVINASGIIQQYKVTKRSQ